jgi:hypothetical protein
MKLNSRGEWVRSVGGAGSSLQGPPGWDRYSHSWNNPVSPPGSVNRACCTGTPDPVPSHARPEHRRRIELGDRPAPARHRARDSTRVTEEDVRPDVGRTRAHGTDRNPFLHIRRRQTRVESCLLCEDMSLRSFFSSVRSTRRSSLRKSARTIPHPQPAARADRVFTHAGGPPSFMSCVLLFVCSDHPRTICGR